MNVFMIIEEVERLASTQLWTGFYPLMIPLAIYDEEKTWLFQHSNPAAEFVPFKERRNTYYFSGLHPSVRANSIVELNGRLTATILLHSLKSLTLPQIASICIHELFHVFQHQNYPKWDCNIVEQFLYPVESAENLYLRRLETLALCRAGTSRDTDEVVSWALTALNIRAQRFAQLPAGSVRFEQGTELLEGLAQYVERKALGLSKARLLVQDYPPEEIRLRCYDTGHALALLLDRFHPAWQHELGKGGSLDTLLFNSISRFSRSEFSFTKAEYEASLTQAQEEIGQLLIRQEEQRRNLFSQPGWVCQIEFTLEHSLKLKALDPMNVCKLSQNEVLHTRMLKADNELGKIEVLDGKAITNGTEGHPFKHGIVKIIIPGLMNKPNINKTENKVQISGDGFSGEFESSPSIHISIEISK